MSAEAQPIPRAAGFQSWGIYWGAGAMASGGIVAMHLLGCLLADYPLGRGSHGLPDWDQELPFGLFTGREYLPWHFRALLVAWGTCVIAGSLFPASGTRAETDVLSEGELFRPRWGLAFLPPMAIFVLICSYLSIVATSMWESGGWRQILVVAIVGSIVATALIKGAVMDELNSLRADSLRQRLTLDWLANSALHLAAHGVPQTIDSLERLKLEARSVAAGLKMTDTLAQRAKEVTIEVGVIPVADSLLELSRDWLAEHKKVVVSTIAELLNEADVARLADWNGIQDLPWADRELLRGANLARNLLIHGGSDTPANVLAAITRLRLSDLRHVARDRSVSALLVGLRDTAPDRSTREIAGYIVRVGGPYGTLLRVLYGGTLQPVFG